MGYHKIQVYNKSIYEQLRKVDDHECNQSDRSCINSKNLKQHIADVHSGQINQNCQDCDKDFMNSCVLNRHIIKAYARYVFT